MPPITRSSLEQNPIPVQVMGQPQQQQQIIQPQQQRPAMMQQPPQQGSPQPQPIQAGPSSGPLPPPMASKMARGMVQAPSLDKAVLGASPAVVIINLGEKTLILPATDGQGRTLQQPEAFEQFKRTGKHLGVFSSPDAAAEYARTNGMKMNDGQGIPPAANPNINQSQGPR